MTMRIAQYLARCGVASRRKAEEFVRAGRVKMNGVRVLDLGRQVNPESDRLEVDGKAVALAQQHLTLAIHKPRYVVVSRNDPEGRDTIYGLIPPKFRNRAKELVHAGRLDYMTSGLQIMSTDGELINQLTHPSHHIEKTYHLTTNRSLSDEEMEEMASGVDIGEATTMPCRVRPLGTEELCRYEVIIAEGKNRQVRRMAEAVGARVARLSREAVGALTLKGLRLKPGAATELDAEQIALLTKPPR